MYRCQLCNYVVKPKVSQNLVILKIRKKKYAFRPKAHRGYVSNRGVIQRPLKRSKKRNDRINDNGGMGWEIEEEAIVCPRCAEKFKNSDKLDD